MNEFSATEANQTHGVVHFDSLMKIPRKPKFSPRKSNNSGFPLSTPLAAPLDQCFTSCYISYIKTKIMQAKQGRVQEHCFIQKHPCFL